MQVARPFQCDTLGRKGTSIAVSTCSNDHEAAFAESSQTSSPADESPDERIERLEDELCQARQKLLEIETLAHVGSCVWDLNSGVMTWSQQFYEILGLDPDEHVPTFDAMVSLIHEADRKGFLSSIEAALAAGSNYSHEHRYVRPNGDLRYVRCSGRIERDHTGSAWRVVTAIQDLTARHQSERALREREEVLQQAFDSIPFDVWLLGGDGKYLMQNAAAYGRWGNHVGQSPEEITDLPPEVIDRWLRNNRRAFAGEIVQGEVDYSFDGELRHVYNIIAPCHVGDKIRMVVGINIDITELKRAEQRNIDSLRYFVSMARVDSIINKQTNPEDILPEVISELLVLFDCDRAWLVFPCDPNASEYNVLYEQTKPDYPGIGSAGRRLPNTQDLKVLCGRALATDGPIEHVPVLDSDSPEYVQQHKIQSRLTIALRPALGEPWLLGLHQCTHPRRWTEPEQRLFQDIARRISNTLSTIIFFRNLADRERQFRMLAENIPGVVYTCLNAEHYTMLYINEQVGTVTGYSKSAFLDQTVNYGDLLHPDDKKDVEQEINRALSARTSFHLEYRLRTCGGEWRWIEEFGTGVFDSQTGEFRFLLGFFHDITSRRSAAEAHRKLEEQIQQAQKLESLGILAGGIAHDFNNLLVGILGHADLMLEDTAEDDPNRDSLKEIETASTRAAELCRQMLAYAGKGRFVIEPLDLGELVREMAELLKVSISKNARLKFDFAPELPRIRGDATQLRQVVMNLITNAAEAVADRGGEILLSTGSGYCSRKHLAGAYLNDHLEEGCYVHLEVKDTGQGMASDTLERIFDPFFSTKFMGRGLGLAAVLGIVRSHQGAIFLKSLPLRGTTFRVLFPALGEPLRREEDQPEAHLAWRGSGTVLLVDDEEMVRMVGGRMLERLGFSVVGANGGAEAIAHFQEHHEQIQCVLLDLTMPQMDGKQTLQELRKISPDVPVVITSGYTRHSVSERIDSEEVEGFLQKPFDLSNLRDTLRQVVSGVSL